MLSISLRRVVTDLRVAKVHPKPIPATRRRDTRRGFGQRVMSTTEPVKRFTPQEVLAKLDSQFERARESGDLLFFPSTVHKHTDVGVDVSFLLFPLTPPATYSRFRNGSTYLSELTISMILFPIDTVRDHFMPCSAKETGSTGH